MRKEPLHRPLEPKLGSFYQLGLGELPKIPTMTWINCWQQLRQSAVTVEHAPREKSRYLRARYPVPIAHALDLKLLSKPFEARQKFALILPISIGNLLEPPRLPLVLWVH